MTVLQRVGLAIILLLFFGILAKDFKSVTLEGVVVAISMAVGLALLILR